MGTKPTTQGTEPEKPQAFQRSGRVFTVTPSGDLFQMHVIEGGHIRYRLLLTATELRGCSDACLAAIGWTPVVNEKRDRDAGAE